MMECTHAYCDGGVVAANPSKIGGTWAVIFVANGLEVARHSGTVTPEQAGLPAITNNYTELLAAVEAMERLPAAWNGTLYTDSNVTRVRIVDCVSRPVGMKGIPADLRKRLSDARILVPSMSVVLLKGHPTKADLARGDGKRGEGKQSLPVSKWNVECDRVCAVLAKRLLFQEAFE